MFPRSSLKQREKQFLTDNVYSLELFKQIDCEVLFNLKQSDEIFVRLRYGLIETTSPEKHCEVLMNEFELVLLLLRPISSQALPSMFFLAGITSGVLFVLLSIFGHARAVEFASQLPGYRSWIFDITLRQSFAFNQKMFGSTEKHFTNFFFRCALNGWGKWTRLN